MMYQGEDDWNKTLKMAGMNNDDTIQLFSELDVEHRLTEDDYNYKIVENLAFWYE